MNAATLLAELATAGITLSRNGDRVHYLTRPGISIAPYRDRITAHKPALLDTLRRREAATLPSTPRGSSQITSVGSTTPRIDSTLECAPGYRGPVEATRPPIDWDGAVPTSCGAPKACQVLGPCPHFVEYGACWKDRVRDFTNP
jgi:hypothetical protein